MVSLLEQISREKLTYIRDMAGGISVFSFCLVSFPFSVYLYTIAGGFSGNSIY